MSEKSTLTDAVRAALSGSGLMPKLKNLLYADTATHDLERKAYAMADNLGQLIDSGKLDDADTQRLMSLLLRLRGAFQGGTISRDALAMALAEAATAVGAVNGGIGKILLQQKTNQVWSEIEKHNRTIDDDFDKMRRAGIVFDQKLWKQHKELSEYLQAHPQDIEKQKELNAVDDQLLQQAEQQLPKVPSAKPHYDHAEKESKERHQKVDHQLVEIRKNAATLDSCNDLEWEDVSTHKNLPSPAGSRTQNSSEKLVRKQTNVCLRTKLTQIRSLSTLPATANAFTIKALLGSLFFISTGSANKSVQR